jgi:HTH-type transcriptional regulator/antitoxin HigA
MQDKHFRAFHDEAMGIPRDLAVLGVLMDQYGLGVNDLPEIGSKSLVSRILSGERNLTKKHIQALSERFGISPAAFFDQVIPVPASSTGNAWRER